jgi:hypothetical protein
MSMMFLHVMVISPQATEFGVRCSGVQIFGVRHWDILVPYYLCHTIGEALR